MTLTDPRGALGDQSSFIDYLMGLAGIGRLVRTLADPGPDPDPDPGSGPDPPVDADDFTYLLLGLAGLGAAIERVAAGGAPRPDQPTRVTTWLR